MMHGDGFILSENDLQKYNGHEQIDKYYFAEGAAAPIIETIPFDCNLEELKQWLRPTNINSADLERWKATPALRILMIKTKNEFSRSPTKYTPTRRTIPGDTEVKPHENQEEHIKFVKEIFRHARLPASAIGAYIKSHITFLSAPTYEVFGEETGTSGGQVTKFYVSGTSWSIAWSYFHSTRHTSAVMFYREGDGSSRRQELESEIFRLRQHITHPLLLAYIKTQVSLVWTFHLLEEMNGQTFEIEKSVGLAVWDWVLDRKIEAYRDPYLSEPDSEENIAKAQNKAVETYNVLSGKLINIKFRLRTFREQIQWLRRMNKTYLTTLKQETDFSARSQECDELDTMLDRMDDFDKVYLHDAETLSERLSQQMASMSHLISQRHSRINMAIGDVNNELAWQGKNTNHAMMAIAVASFVFLPATFIAGVFDTPIFSWGPPEDGRTINTEPFWIFWVACASTTALLCLCWMMYLRWWRALEKEKRLDARKEFRQRILRVPTFPKRGKKETTPDSADGQHHNWFAVWSKRIAPRNDLESGIGVGAYRAVSFEKTS